MNGQFCARLDLYTLNDLLTRKHRQRVSTLKKWLSLADKTRRRFAAVLACREVSRTLILGNPKPFLKTQIFLQNIRFTFGKSSPAAVIVAKGTSRPFPVSRKGGERNGFTGFTRAHTTPV